MNTGYIKPYRLKSHLHDWSGAKCTDNGADSDRTPEEPSDKCCHSQKRNAHSSYRNLLNPLGKGNQQSIPRSAARIMFIMIALAVPFSLSLPLLNSSIISH